MSAVILGQWNRSRIKDGVRPLQDVLHHYAIPLQGPGLTLGETN